MAKSNYYMGQKILGFSYLPAGGWAKGRNYFWMQDGDGTVYLTKAKPVEAVSVNEETGETEKFIVDWVPDFT